MYKFVLGGWGDDSVVNVDTEEVLHVYDDFFFIELLEVRYLVIKSTVEEGGGQGSGSYETTRFKFFDTTTKKEVKRDWRNDIFKENMFDILSVNLGNLK